MIQIYIQIPTRRVNIYTLQLSLFYLKTCCIMNQAWPHVGLDSFSIKSTYNIWMDYNKEGEDLELKLQSWKCLGKPNLCRCCGGYGKLGMIRLVKMLNYLRLKEEIYTFKVRNRCNQYKQKKLVKDVDKARSCSARCRSKLVQITLISLIKICDILIYQKVRRCYLKVHIM